MTLRYLLDTNAISQPFREPNGGVAAQIGAARGRCAVGAPTWHELRFGALRLPAGRKRDALLAYLGGAGAIIGPVLPYDSAAAEWHAAERARLAAEGQPPSFADGQIAAIAATRRLILVTRNTKDFEAFRDLELENWDATR